MIGLSALFIVVLTATSIYMMLSRNTQRVVMGFIVLSNAANLVVLIAAGLPADPVAPLLTEPMAGTLTDPLPQAFILTAIVIGLGNTAFLISMAERTHKETKTDELEEPRWE